MEQLSTDELQDRIFIEFRTETEIKNLGEHVLIGLHPMNGTSMMNYEMTIRRYNWSHWPWPHTPQNQSRTHGVLE